HRSGLARTGFMEGEQPADAVRRDVPTAVPEPSAERRSQRRGTLISRTTVSSTRPPCRLTTRSTAHEVCDGAHSQTALSLPRLLAHRRPWRLMPGRLRAGLAWRSNMAGSFPTRPFHGVLQFLRCLGPAPDAGVADGPLLPRVGCDHRRAQCTFANLLR